MINLIQEVSGSKFGYVDRYFLGFIQKLRVSAVIEHSNKIIPLGFLALNKIFACHDTLNN
jgi:hypothetical protein